MPFSQAHIEPTLAPALPLPRRRFGRMLASPARVAGLWAAVAGVVLTLLFKVIPALDFAYRRPALRAGLKTAEALVALLVAYLVIGRLGRTRKLDDFAIAVALGVLAAGNFMFGVLPTLVGGVDALAGWAAIGARLVGGLLLAAAALAPGRPLLTRARPGPIVAALTMVAVALIVGAAAALQQKLPQPLLGSGQSLGAKPPELSSHLSVLIVQIVTMCACTIAAVGFARSSERRPDDELLVWFGAACVFGTYASLTYAISPAVFYTEWVYPADVLLLLFYVMLLVGAAREINSYWRRLARAAVSDERRRLARDLHDGLAQELAYIRRAAKELQQEVDEDVVARLHAAAQRAVHESRQVIAALAAPGEPLEAMLDRVAHEAAARHGAAVELDLARGPRLDAARTEALVRITSEAVANAARHSGATTIRVLLEWRGGRPRLRVSDNGDGFDRETAGRNGGFGLTSMRERAAAVGARLDLETAPGSGTTLEVAF